MPSNNTWMEKQPALRQYLLLSLQKVPNITACSSTKSTSSLRQQLVEEVKKNVRNYGKIPIKEKTWETRKRNKPAEQEKTTLSP